MKVVYLSNCSQCPHQEKTFVLNEDGYNEVVSATCNLTNTQLNYTYYQNVEQSFPLNCPLTDV